MSKETVYGVRMRTQKDDTGRVYDRPELYEWTSPLTGVGGFGLRIPDADKPRILEESIVLLFATKDDYYVFARYVLRCMQDAWGKTDRPIVEANQLCAWAINPHWPLPSRHITVEKEGGIDEF